eukprot:scaffold4216_cov389-Prasinococcus_capsulatus_cf.AAC.6
MDLHQERCVPQAELQFEGLRVYPTSPFEALTEAFVRGGAEEDGILHRRDLNEVRLSQEAAAAVPVEEEEPVKAE